MKKATLQEIASSLGVSRTTVWKVFSGQEGVSGNLREKILAKARELDYKFPEELDRNAVPEKKDVNIAVAVCRPETSIFWMNIIHQIAKEFSFTMSIWFIPIFLRLSRRIIRFPPSCLEEAYTVSLS